MIVRGELANHAGLVSDLAEETLKVRHVDGKEDRWQVSGGCFDVSENGATELADAISGSAPGRCGCRGLACPREVPSRPPHSIRTIRRVAAPVLVDTRTNATPAGKSAAASVNV